MEDYYVILCVSRNAGADEIRRSYQCLAKRLHPDKHDAKLSTEEREAAIQQFHKVRRAYGVLSEEKLRHEYDTKLKAFELSQQWPVSDTVDLNQMDYDEQEDKYSYCCRCGESYQVTGEDLGCGVTVVCCSGCSLCIKLVVSSEAGRPSCAREENV